MIEAIKVVSIDPDGRRVSAMRHRLPDDYVQVYVEADGTANVVSTALVFEDVDAARIWIGKDRKLEVWSCNCREAESATTLFSFSGMREISAFVRAPYDPDEMAALVSGRATRIWPKTATSFEPNEGRVIFDVVGYKRYSREISVPGGSLIARDVVLVRPLPSM